MDSNNTVCDYYIALRTHASGEKRSYPTFFWKRLMLSVLCSYLLEGIMSCHRSEKREVTGDQSSISQTKRNDSSGKQMNEAM